MQLRKLVAGRPCCVFALKGLLAQESFNFWFETIRVKTVNSARKNFTENAHLKVPGCIL